VSNGYGAYVNDLGQVAGTAFGPSGERAYFWPGGTSTPIQISSLRSFALGGNIRAEVVGFDFAFDQIRAFGWQNGIYTTLVGPYRGSSIAYAVNDSGIVVGAADIPEPAAVLLFALGMTAVLAFRRRFQLKSIRIDASSLRANGRRIADEARVFRSAFPPH
jgi:uncharacterized membrane protein